MSIQPSLPRPPVPAWAALATFFLVSAALPASSPAAAAEERFARGESRLQVVDEAIAFHGGPIYRSSRTRLALCSASGCSQLDVTIDGGRYELIAEAPVRAGNRRVRSTNDAVEHWLDAEPQEISAAEGQRLRDWVMARVYFCFLPFRLNDPGVFKQDLGLETWDGRELRRVKVTFEAGTGTDSQDEYTYWLAPDSGRVEMFAYSYQSGGPGLRFRRGFNYRRVGGILFFDQENWGVEGENLTVDLLTPDFVRTSLRRVSTVELREIAVAPLG